MITFLNLPVNTMNEIMGNEVSSLIVRWYKDQNTNDEIDLISDTYDDWPFSGGDRSEMASYKEITEETLFILIKKGLVKDLGIEWQDEDEPDTVYIRKLKLT